MLNRWEFIGEDETIIPCKAETRNKNLVEIKAFLDCGAFYNFIPRDLAQSYHINIKKLKVKKKVHGYQGRNGTEEYITECAEFPLKIGEHYELIRCYLVNSCGRHQMILGHRWLRKHDCGTRLGQGK